MLEILNGLRGFIFFHLFHSYVTFKEAYDIRGFKRKQKKT